MRTAGTRRRATSGGREPRGPRGAPDRATGTIPGSGRCDGPATGAAHPRGVLRPVVANRAIMFITTTLRPPVTAPADHTPENGGAAVTENGTGATLAMFRHNAIHNCGAARCRTLSPRGFGYKCRNRRANWLCRARCVTGRPGAAAAVFRACPARAGRRGADPTRAVRVLLLVQDARQRRRVGSCAPRFGP